MSASDGSVFHCGRCGASLSHHCPVPLDSLALDLGEVAEELGDLLVNLDARTAGKLEVQAQRLRAASERLKALDPPRLSTPPTGTEVP
jgi:hypothetical protein